MPPLRGHCLAVVGVPNAIFPGPRPTYLSRKSFGECPLAFTAQHVPRVLLFLVQERQRKGRILREEVDSE